MFELTIISIFLISIPTLIQSNNSELIQNNNRLALNLLNALSRNENNFYSPLSITYSLHMLLNGANGVTESEIKTLLNIGLNETLDSINDDIKNTLNSIRAKNLNEVIVRFASRILTSNLYNLYESFKNSIRNKFDSEVVSVDFLRDANNITENINDWIREQTNGKIDRLFSLLRNDTLLVISNALYFSANWDIPFDPYSTHESDFFGLDEKQTKVQMMTSMRKFKYSSSQQLNASLIELPFSDGSNISMIIILPNERNGLKNTIENLNLTSFNLALDDLYNNGTTQLNLSLPKFDLQTEYNLENPLKKLGLTTLFDTSADLSGITGKRNLRVSEAIHKAVFRVTETGAEASGAVGIVGTPHMWIPPKNVSVNRPFLFLIQDNKSGLVLFLGQVLEI